MASSFAEVSAFFSDDADVVSPPFASTSSAAEAPVASRPFVSGGRRAGVGSAPAARPASTKVVAASTFLKKGSKRGRSAYGDVEEDVGVVQGINNHGLAEGSDDETSEGGRVVRDPKKKVKSLQPAVNAASPLPPPALAAADDDEGEVVGASAAASSSSGANSKKKLGKKERLALQASQALTASAPPPDAHVSSDETTPTYRTDLSSKKTKRAKTRSKQKNIRKDKRILDGTLPDKFKVAKFGEKGAHKGVRPLTKETRDAIGIVKNKDRPKAQESKTTIRSPEEEERRREAAKAKKDKLLQSVKGDSSFVNIK